MGTTLLMPLRFTASKMSVEMGFEGAATSFPGKTEECKREDRGRAALRIRRAISRPIAPTAENLFAFAA